MIFVTVGTHTAGFGRLVSAMDSWAAVHEEPVHAQIGHTTFQPVHCNWFRFAPPEEIDYLIRQARVVVMHAGAGTLLGAIEARASVVVVPRQPAFGEHIDHHQFELATALDEAGLARAVIDVADLPRALMSGGRLEPPSVVHRSELVAAIRHALADWARAR